MKKVLFVATVVKLHIMVFHIPYLEWFKENGYEVHVAAKNDYENKEDCNIPFCDKFFDLPFERLPLKKNNFYAQKELKKIININKYEVIHCHTPIGGALTRISAREARKNGTKVIYTVHGFHFYKGAPFINWLLYYPIERWLAKYTDVLITINKEDYERAKSKFKATRVKYIPGIGIDLKKFKTIEVSREWKRSELCLPKDAFVVLSVGELNKNKNHEAIIRAIAKIDNLKIHYVICGQGQLDQYLRNLSKELDIEKQVHLLGFRKDIPEICKSSDLFAFPSFREGLSVALMEAMASGLPVVCSKIRGNSDLIENGKGGYLVDPQDIYGFARAIEKLLNNKELRNEMRHYNKEVVKNFQVKSVLDKMNKIYEKVLLYVSEKI